MNGTCNSIIFWVPVPLGHWGEAKRSNIIESQSERQLQSFLKQTFDVFSQINYIRYVRPDFNSVALFMPQGCDLGVPWGLGIIVFPKFNQIWCVSYLHEWHMQRHNFWGPRLLGPWGGAKRLNIVKSQLQSQFQRFLI